MRALLTIAALACAIPDRPAPDAATPQLQILGDWRYIGSRKEPDLPPGAPDFVLRILASESIWLERSMPKPANGFTARIVVDWSKTPVAIDLMPKHGGTALRGIIRLEGDHLTLAWSHNDVRPTGFVGAANIHHFTRVRK